MDYVSHATSNTTSNSQPSSQSTLYTTLYGVATTLSVLLFAMICLSFYLFRLYKKEANLRLMMWKVKMTDVSQEMQLNSSPTMKRYGITSCSSYDQLDSIHDDDVEPHSYKRRQYFGETCYYKGRIAAVKRLQTRRMSFDKNRLSDMDQIFMLHHEHLCAFYGAHQQGATVTLLTEYCSRGSLDDLFENRSDLWDDVFKNSLIFDIVKGMQYLHRSVIGSHGNLKPSNCLIDSRFVVKISDFGVIGQRIKAKKKSSNELTSNSFKQKLWTAPELLRAIIVPIEGTKEGDVYSFGIIAQQILFQRGVFYRKDCNYTPEEIVNRVMSPSLANEIFRPSLDDDDFVIISQVWRRTLRLCWHEDERRRSTFDTLFKVSKSFQKEETLIDSLFERLEKYTHHLEEKVEEKTEQYKAEKEKSDNLLYQMLPRSVADTLKKDKEVTPESYEQVTVYFSDIVGFSAICHRSQPLEVAQMLNDLYTMFDHIIDEFDVYKVETIGDAYMVVSGLPIRNGDNHAREIARMALRLRHSVCNEFEIRHLPNEKMKLRIGIHTGPVVAAVVGRKMPRYCLFGDTVNTASRMESNGKELKIHISPQTKEILDKFETFDIKKRRQSVALKGIGEWNTWWLVGENGFSSPSPIKKKKFSVASTFVTGCFDDDDVLAVADISENSTDSENMKHLQVQKKMPRLSIYERKNSGLLDFSKSKTSQKIKRRREGIINKPLLSTKKTNSDTTERAPSSSSQSSRSGDSLVTIDENDNQQQRRTGSAIVIPRDSGVSMAFDNVVCTEITEQISAC